MRIGCGFKPFTFDDCHITCAYRLTKPDVTIQCRISAFTLFHLQTENFRKMRVVGVVHRQQANIIGRIYNESLIGIVEDVLRVKAHPYFGKRLADGWYQDVP